MCQKRISVYYLFDSVGREMFKQGVKKFPPAEIVNAACGDGNLRVRKCQSPHAVFFCPAADVHKSLFRKDGCRLTTFSKRLVNFVATTCGEAMLRTASENSGLGLMLAVAFIASAKAQASPTGT